MINDFLATPLPAICIFYIKCFKLLRVKLQSIGKSVILDLSPGSVTKQLGSLYRCCLLSLFCKTLCYNYALIADLSVSCKILHNLSYVYIRQSQLERKNSLVKEEGRRYIASHVSYFYTVPERLSAETSSQALTPHPCSSKNPSTPRATVGIFGKAPFLLDSF